MNDAKKKKPKYLISKNFYIKECLLDITQNMKVSPKAEKLDEEFYVRLYERKCARFVSNDSKSDWYRDPEEALRKIDEYVSEPGIPPEEYIRRLFFKYVQHNMEQKARTFSKVYRFDEEVSKRIFAEHQKTQIAYCNLLPQAIREKIADIRVFVLGYTSAEVKRMLRSCRSEMRSYIRDAQFMAELASVAALNRLEADIEFSDYIDALIMSIEERDGDVYLKTEDGGCLRITDGEITDGKDEPIFPYNKELPNCAWSRIVAAEFYRVIDDIYELHLVVSNCDEFDREKLWDLTIKGTDFTELT